MELKVKAKIQKGRRIVIPKAICEALGLKEGSKVMVKISDEY